MNNFQKTIEQLQHILKLSPEEKLYMRTKVIHAIKTTPLSSPYVLRHTFHFTRTLVFRGILALLIIILGGGASIFGVSAQALPGDILYATKINLENFQANLKVSPTSKIAFDIKRTESRFEEVRQLVKDGTFDDVKQDIISKNIENHVISATQEVSKVAFSEPKHHKIITEQIKETLEQEREKIIELVAEETLVAHGNALLPETNNLLALGEVVKATQEQVLKIEKIQEIITEAIEETEDMTSSETNPDIKVITAEELIDTSISISSDVTTETPTTSEDDKIFIEKALTQLKIDVEKIRKEKALPSLSPTVLPAHSIIDVKVDSPSILSTTTGLVVEEVLIPKPTTDIYTDIFITYDLLISAYESANYSVGKTLLIKIEELMKTSVNPAQSVLLPISLETDSSITNEIPFSVNFENNTITDSKNKTDIETVTTTL